MTGDAATRRRCLGALAAAPFLLGAARAALASTLWSALRAPAHVALIRHAMAPGTFDPPGFRIGDCATQRNLSSEGRAQAERIGDLFRANGIASAQVFSSQWCRCLDTATLLRLGDVAPQPLLNSFAEDRGRGAQQIADLRAWLARQPLTSPTVLVTHQVVITGLSRVFPASGEIVVLRRDAGPDFIVVGRQPTA
ncbi:MAG: histidine phosphatase family protein [Pseudomonadota bacterium]